MAGIRDTHRRAGQKQILKKILTVLIFIAAVIGFLGGFLYWTVSDLPSIKILEEYAPLESSRVFSCDGKLIAELFVERRTYVPYYQIPGHVKKAFISVEDVRFYQHPGVDMLGILRALWSDIKAGSVVEGGSTITQQLARMMFLTSERSLKRKIKESALSIKIERYYTKDEILGMYLNQAYFGTRAYGIEAAAQTYFGSTTTNLGIAEAALLASLPKAPSLYSPFKNPEKAGKRRSVVLRRMRENNFITEAQAAEAESVPLPETPHFRKYEAPYFIETLRQQLEKKYGKSLYTSGYNIHSTIDFGMQQAAEKAVRHGIASLRKRVAPGVEAALVAIDVRTGHVKALVGGADFWKNQFNRATQALRQPGSAFKPFVYATAIQHGMIATDIVEDAPISFKGARPGQVWSPRNYDGEYHGEVTLQEALAKSLNSATVRLASKVGLRSVIDTAKKLGIRSKLSPYFPLALGASDVTLIDMVSAYSAFVSGYRPEPLFYERVLNRNDVLLEEKDPVVEKVLYAEDVEQIRILMKSVIEEGTGKGAKALGREVFGKTGTTNDYTDAWFVGFDERISVGVWVGRDNHRSLGRRETGARAALPIWIEFMRKVPQQIPTVQNP